MITFDGVSKRYPGGQEALSQVSFTLARGELAFLSGHSGAGKSTLLKLLLLMERPSQGQILVGGQNLARISRRQLPYYRRQIGVVFQDHQLLFERSVFDNVALPLQVMGLDSREIGRRVRAALDKVGLLHKERQLPQALSGGEQQRVGIARAVVHRPPLLLADEPTGNLDAGLSAEIMNLFEQFNAVGVTLLIASHDLSLLARHQHRRLQLEQGRLLADGLPAAAAASVAPAVELATASTVRESSGAAQASSGASGAASAPESSNAPAAAQAPEASKASRDPTSAGTRKATRAARAFEAGSSASAGSTPVKATTANKPEGS